MPDFRLAVPRSPSHCVASLFAQTRLGCDSSFALCACQPRAVSSSRAPRAARTVAWRLGSSATASSGRTSWACGWLGSARLASGSVALLRLRGASDPRVFMRVVGALGEGRPEAVDRGVEQDRADEPAEADGRPDQGDDLGACVTSGAACRVRGIAGYCAWCWTVGC